jgi:hypothetical protein
MSELIWTKERPKEPGWYWWRGDWYGPEVLQVYLLNGPDTDQLAIDETEIERHDGEWAGPIPLPQEAAP